MPLPQIDLSVRVLGAAASRILARRDHGLVLAVFSRSFYLRFADDVICVGPMSLGAGPLNLLCGLPETFFWADCDVTQSQAVAWAGESLSLGDSLRLDFAAAAKWQAPAAPPFRRADLAAGLARLAAVVIERSPGGLGPLIPGLLSLRPGADAEAAPKDPLLRAARAPIAALLGWVLAALAGAGDPVPDCAALIGLGPGLTPSGDDFLCGAMAALHHLGHAGLARRLAARILPQSEATGIISRSFLRCAAEGELSAVFFEVLHSLLAGGDRRLAPGLARLDAIGHSSGWDTLAGAAAICAALCRAGDAVPAAAPSA